jgi:hypothetical protein
MKKLIILILILMTISIVVKGSNNKIICGKQVCRYNTTGVSLKSIQRLPGKYYYHSSRFKQIRNNLRKVRKFETE